MDIMIEFLEMCGFDTDEANMALPRIKRLFNKIGITREDIEPTKQRLRLYYDLELEGVRKILRFCLLETADTVLAREEGKKNVVFGFMAPALDVIGTAMMSASRDVLFAHQCWAIQSILGCVFDKLVPVLEAAEKQWLKSGAMGHCANIKTLLGLITLDILPKPDLLLTTGFSCEAAPKTVDLLHEVFGIPVCCIDTCQDRAFDDYAESSRRTIGLAARSLKDAVARICRTIGLVITDEMIWDALAAKGALIHVLQQITELIETSDPMPISATHHSLFMSLVAMTFTRQTMPLAVDAARTLLAELQARIDDGIGVLPKGAPRVLGILPCHHADPRLEHLAGEMGVALAALDIGFESPYPDTPSDPYEIVSLHLQQALASSLSVRSRLIADGCRKLNIDGVLNRYHVGCRTVAGDALMIDHVSKNLGIPALLLEWENFDPRVYAHEPYQKRFELFKMMMENSKRSSCL